MANFNIPKSKQNTLIAPKWLRALAPYTQASPVVFVGAAAPLVLETPYRQELAAFKPEQGQLHLNMTSFDCVTLVETLLALRLVLKMGHSASVKDLSKALTVIRYRQNTANDYAARLHYFSDWLYENDNKGIITDITKSLSGKKRTKIINWMSRHRQDYPPLEDSLHLASILEIEARLSCRGFFYIPKNQIAAIEQRLQQGDIIAFTSSQKGLDIAHCGFAFHTDARQCLLHASSTARKVELSCSSIATYAQERSDVDGIVVARML